MKVEFIVEKIYRITNLPMFNLAEPAKEDAYREIGTKIAEIASQTRGPLVMSQSTSDEYYRMPGEDLKKPAKLRKFTIVMLISEGEK